MFRRSADDGFHVGYGQWITHAEWQEARSLLDLSDRLQRVVALATEVEPDEPHVDHGGGNGEEILYCARCWRDGILAALAPALSMPEEQA